MEQLSVRQPSCDSTLSFSLDIRNIPTLIKVLDQSHRYHEYNYHCMQKMTRGITHSRIRMSVTKWTCTVSHATQEHLHRRLWLIDFQTQQNGSYGINGWYMLVLKQWNRHTNILTVYRCSVGMRFIAVRHVCLENFVPSYLAIIKPLVLINQRIIIHLRNTTKATSWKISWMTSIFQRHYQDNTFIWILDLCEGQNLSWKQKRQGPYNYQHWW